MVYCFGYFLSVSILTPLLDQVEFNSIISMLLTNIIMALYFYRMQKYLVVRETLIKSAHDATIRE